MNSKTNCACNEHDHSMKMALEDYNRNIPSKKPKNHLKRKKKRMKGFIQDFDLMKIKSKQTNKKFNYLFLL